MTTLPQTSGSIQECQCGLAQKSACPNLGRNDADFGNATLVEHGNATRRAMMKTILVPTEQHELMTSMLQTAVLLARKFDSYIEGFPLFPAMVELYALDSGVTLPLEIREHDVEMAKQARSVFETFMNDHGVA